VPEWRLVAELGPYLIKASALRAAAPVAADEQDAMPGVLTGQGVIRASVDHGPVIVAVALGAVAGPESLPGIAGQPGPECGSGEAARRGGHAVARGDGDRVVVAQFAYRVRRSCPP
jgi:hypothetical protein